MKRSPEALVASLRVKKNKKWRIVTHTFVVLVLLNLVAYYCCVLASNLFVALLLPQNPGGHTIYSLIHGTLLYKFAFLNSLTMFLAACLGIEAMNLVTELTTFAKDDLLVQLWDRVQALEMSQQGAAGGQQPQDPTPPAPPAQPG
jgi:hypothetical protein